MKNDLELAQRFAIAQLWDVVQGVVFDDGYGCPEVVRAVGQARRDAFAALFGDTLEVTRGGDV